MLKGEHLIAGEWVGGSETFTNEPVSGAADSFARGTVELVNRAVEAAEEAFWSYGYSSRASRAAFLREIAIEIDARGDEITAMGMKETGLPKQGFRVSGAGRPVSSGSLPSISKRATIWTSARMAHCPIVSPCRARISG